MRQLLVILLLTCLVACQHEIVSDDPNMQISFSHDTVLFDTVFTTMGSSTKLVMVYNPNRQAVQIEQVSMQEGKHFRINLDGENNIEELRDITLRISQVCSETHLER